MGSAHLGSSNLFACSDCLVSLPLFDRFVRLSSSLLVFVLIVRVRHSAYQFTVGFFSFICALFSWLHLRDHGKTG